MKTSKLVSFVAATIISIISAACATVEQHPVAAPQRVIVASAMNADAVVEAHRLESSFSFPEIKTPAREMHEAPATDVSRMVHADDAGRVVAAK